MSDKTWNQEVIERLQAMLPCDTGKRIYVADSALVTNDNLDLLFEKEDTLHFTATGNLQHFCRTEKLGMVGEPVAAPGVFIAK